MVEGWFPSIFSPRQRKTMGFNKTASGTKRTANLAGGVSYVRDSFKQEIIATVLSSLMKGDSFYKSFDEKLLDLFKLTQSEQEQEFLAKTMVYVRNEGNLRTVSHILAVGLAETVKGQEFLRKAIYKTISRPDDAIEMVALWNLKHKDSMIPNSMRRAIKDAFEDKFNEYQLKKYAKESSVVKLKDIIKLARPNPQVLVSKGLAKDIDVFKRVIEDTLDNIDTTETINASNKGEDRAKAYKDILTQGKLAYMASLKNIKNIVECGSDGETIDMLCTLIKSEKHILNSKVLPFRFAQAYSAVDKLETSSIVKNKIQESLEVGFSISSKNIPIVLENETVAILLDESGSMGDDENSPFFIGKTLASSIMCGIKKSQATLWLWSDTAREVKFTSPLDFVFSTRTQGGGTEVNAAISGLINSNTKVDKLIIFTDMEMYHLDRYSSSSLYNKNPRIFSSSLDAYKQISPNVKVLFWNLEGYNDGSPIVLTDSIMEVSGYSDKLLEVIPKMWEDSDALIKEIESISLNQ
jgi:uncharacterized protein with von Willebrand factor type A (vWA) domain